MCEFIVRRVDNRILRCEPNDFAWGAMESHEVFVKSHRQFSDWHDKLYLIKCPDLGVMEGKRLVTKVYSPGAIGPTLELLSWQMLLGAKDG